VIDRVPTNSVKWSYVKRRTGHDDVIPLFIADMDFGSSTEIVEALKERISHPVYGYTVTPNGYYNGLINWMEKHHEWSGIQRDWILSTPGVVTGLCFAIQAFTHPGDKIVIQPPVYFPFRRVISNNGRQVVNNPLKIVEGNYLMDFEDLREKIDVQTKMLILCSPHNPVGRVWKREELEQLVEVCVEKDIVIVSDEIHCDLILGETKHTPIASISEEAEERTVTVGSPSKTFNLAGLNNAHVIIPNKKMRDTFRNHIGKNGIHNHICGMISQEVAYNEGKVWLEEVLEYLRGNKQYLEEFIVDKIPSLKVYPLEGTFLAWLDCSSLGMGDDELDKFMLNKAKLWLNQGSMFGEEGSLHMRINIATPRVILKQALENLEKAVKEL
jgi:cystathionine beta-lyase